MTVLNSPIILMCSERSGSNLIRVIFDAHPDIAAPGACHLFKVMSECASKYPIGSDTLRVSVWELFDAKVSSWLIDDIPTSKRAHMLAPLDRAADMVATIYAAEAWANRKTSVFIKENSIYQYTQFLHGVTAQARYLFMVRDPRDMALSWLKAPELRGGLMRSVQRWVDDQSGFLRTLTHLPDSTLISFLRFEDLLKNPVMQLQRVCAELHVPFSDMLVDFNNNNASARRDAARSRMWKNLTKPIMSDNLNKFAEILTDDELAFLEAKAGNLMRSFGYVPSRKARPQFGRFKSLSDLASVLAENEPHIKPEYMDLPKEERDRLENWSQLYASMCQHPDLTPSQLHRSRP